MIYFIQLLLAGQFSTCLKLIVGFPLITLLAVVIVLDIVTTAYAMTKWPGRVREMNPVARWFIDHIGLVPGLVLLKTFWILLVAYFYVMMPNWLVGMALAMHALAVWNNWQVIRSLRIKYGTSG